MNNSGSSTAQCPRGFQVLRFPTCPLGNAGIFHPKRIQNLSFVPLTLMICNGSIEILKPFFLPHISIERRENVWVFSRSMELLLATIDLFEVSIGNA